MDKDLLKIINHYGIRNQLKKLSEEVYEFQESILMDDGSEECLEHIIEECADIEVILDQFKKYYEIEYSKIAQQEVFKIMRTLERIEKE